MRRGRERDTGIRQQRYQEDMKKEQEEETPGTRRRCLVQALEERQGTVRVRGP
jgi:hypothetical protein